jgi:hypothetical protein
MTKTANATTTEAPPRLGESLRGLARILPAPARALLQARLGSFPGWSDWLPEGLDPQLDASRAEQHRLLALVAAEAEKLRGLRQKWNDEDAGREAALREAHRRGDPVPADSRAPPHERKAAEEGPVGSITALLEVLDEHAGRTIQLICELEDEVLAGLRARQPQVEAMRRDADRLMEQACAAEWELFETARWFMRSADDVTPQPFPSRVPAPANWTMPPHVLERPWHKLKPWNADYEELEAGREGEAVA